jgi:hypothetical protein
MSWEAMSAVSSACGAIAVTITVIYLAIQTRKNALALQSQTLYQATAGLAELSAFCAADLSRVRLLRLGYSASEELTEDEYLQFSMLSISQFRRFENLYLQHKAGLIGDDFWAGHHENIIWFFHRPGNQIWWKRRRLSFSKSFREYLERTRPEETVSPADRTL